MNFNRVKKVITQFKRQKHYGCGMNCKTSVTMFFTQFCKDLYFDSVWQKAEFEQIYIHSKFSN